MLGLMDGKLDIMKGVFFPFRFDFDPHLLSMKSDNWIAVPVNASLYTDGIPREMKIGLIGVGFIVMSKLLFWKRHESEISRFILNFSNVNLRAPRFISII